MKSIGVLLIILGLASIDLKVFDTGYEMTFLLWIEQWGQETGWAIRGGAVALGVLLWIIGASMGSSEKRA